MHHNLRQHFRRVPSVVHHAEATNDVGPRHLKQAFLPFKVSKLGVNTTIDLTARVTSDDRPGALLLTGGIQIESEPFLGLLGVKFLTGVMVLEE